MKRVIKIGCLLLISAMVSSVFISCGDNTEDAATTVENVVLDTQRKGNKLDIVPYNVEFKDETFNILCRADGAWGDFTHELTADGVNGSYVDMAVAKRNQTVEKRFGVTFKYTTVPGYWEYRDEFLQYFRDCVNSGLGNFDLVMGNQGYMADASLLGLCTNYYTVPYIKDDLDSDYFLQDAVDTLTVDGKLFYLVGDYCLSYLENLNVMFFNKDIAAQHIPFDLYDTVRSGDWTIDKCIELSSGIYSDLNKNGIVDDSDRFGYMTDIASSTDAFISQFDVTTTKRDENGNYILDGSQGKMVKILDKMLNFFSSDAVNTIDTYPKLQTDDPHFDSLFGQGKALFYPSTLKHAENYIKKTINFGILPLPKWNADQEGYYTQAENVYSIAIIPADAPNLKKSGAILDVLMADSSKNVTPVFYENNICKDYTEDCDDAEMVDIIVDGAKINFAYFHYNDMQIAGFARYMIVNKRTDFVSFYSAKQRFFEHNLDKLLDRYAEAGEPLKQ